jgi:predicted DNA-binding protein with PD1-like motif
MQAFPTTDTRTMLVTFKRGDLIVELLTGLIREEGIDTALITSGLGAFDRCNLHTIAGTGLPPEEHFIHLEGPVEVGSILGNVAGGEPHIHAVVHDVANDKVYAGHLEPDTRVCYRAAVGLIVLNDVRTARREDPDTGLVDVVPA